MARIVKWTRIYGIHHPTTHDCVYVGRTHQSIEQRFNGHQNYPISYKFRIWFQDLRAQGLEPYINVWEEFHGGGPKKVKQREAVWIRKFRDNGFDLFNTHEYTPKRTPKSTDVLLSTLVTRDEYRQIRKDAANAGMVLSKYIKGKLLPVTE